MGSTDDPSVLARQSTPATETPTSFADLNGASTGDPCRRCGEAATHSATIRVTELGKRGGGPTAMHTARLCEKCAVGLFVQVRKVMR